MPGRRYILGSRYLDLDVRTVGDAGLVLLHIMLLACRIVEILSCLIYKLIRRGATHGQIDMLCGAAPCRTCPSL